MDQLLPQASRVMNGAEGLPLIESAATSAKAEPVIPKDLVDAAGDVLAADAGTHLVYLDQNRAMRIAGMKEQDPSETTR